MSCGIKKFQRGFQMVPKSIPNGSKRFQNGSKKLNMVPNGSKNIQKVDSKPSQRPHYVMAHICLFDPNV